MSTNRQRILSDVPAHLSGDPCRPLNKHGRHAATPAALNRGVSNAVGRDEPGAARHRCHDHGRAAHRDQARILGHDPCRNRP